MDTSCFQDGESRKPPGFAAFVVLILGVGIMVFLFVLYTGALNPFAAFQGTEKDRYSDPNAYPWEEEHLFINKQLDGYDMGGRRPPFRAQPKLTDLLTYRATVYDDGKKYGQIELTISDNGDAWALWNGDFQIGNEPYQAIVHGKTPYRMNLFRGNIAPLKIYEDENGRDKSKLYVITRGFFHLKGLSEERSLTGPAYVTCWVDKDYYAEGELAIPSFADKQTMIFSWGPVGPAEE